MEGGRKEGFGGKEDGIKEEEGKLEKVKKKGTGRGDNGNDKEEDETQSEAEKMEKL